MRCSRHDHKLLFAAQLRERCPVQLNDLDVVSADNKQRRSPNVHQSRAGQIGTAASRDNRAHHIEADSRRHQCGSGAGTGTEVTDPKLLRIGEFREPVSRGHEPFGEQLDIEAQLCRTRVDYFLVQRQQVNQQGCQFRLVEQASDITIARTVPAAAAAVGK